MQRSFTYIQVDLNLQTILQGHPTENENIVQIVDTFLTRMNVFLLSQSKLLRLSISSVLRSIHMQLEMEPTSVAAEPPPQPRGTLYYIWYCSNW